MQAPGFLIGKIIFGWLEKLTTLTVIYHHKMNRLHIWHSFSSLKIKLSLIVGNRDLVSWVHTIEIRNLPYLSLAILHFAVKIAQK